VRVVIIPKWAKEREASPRDPEEGTARDQEEDDSRWFLYEREEDEQEAVRGPL